MPTSYFAPKCKNAQIPERADDSLESSGDWLSEMPEAPVTGIAIGRAQVQYALGALLGSA